MKRHSVRLVSVLIMTSWCSNNRFRYIQNIFIKVVLSQIVGGDDSWKKKELGWFRFEGTDSFDILHCVPMLNCNCAPVEAELVAVRVGHNRTDFPPYSEGCLQHNAQMCWCPRMWGDGGYYHRASFANFVAVASNLEKFPKVKLWYFFNMLEDLCLILLQF